jgi:F-type H+-transporting ATPase subunit gamma
MANTQILKRRMRSVRNTRQITKAMEMVAASKLRRMGEAVNFSRSYNDITASIIRQLANNQEVKNHPYFAPPASKSKLYVVFTSDRGLVGALNTNAINEALRSFSDDRKVDITPSVIVIGRKGARFFSRLKDINLLGEYEGVADKPELNVFAPILETINTGLRNGTFSSVDFIFTGYRSTLIQQVQKSQVLPVTLIQEAQEKPDKPEHKIVYELEPSPEAVLEKALRLYIESQLVHARIETAASEYAMQMMAMSSATRNAGDLIDNLTLELNATRQAAITQEIAEITGGAAAIAS